MPPKTAPHIALSHAVNKAIKDGAHIYISNPPPAPPRAETVISFDPDGSIEFTRSKNLDGFFGGAGTMKRVTDIKKAEQTSEFRILWLMGPYTNYSQTYELHLQVFGEAKPLEPIRIDGNTGTFWFKSYEDAVSYEIRCLNTMRTQGITFAGA